MRKIRILAAIASAALWAGIPGAAAQSVKYVTLSPKSVRITYDSNVEQSSLISAVFAIEKGSTEMNYYVTFDPAPASRVASNGSYTLSYSIFDAVQLPRRELLDEVTAQSASEVLTGVFPTPPKNKGPTDERSFALVIPPGGFVPSGTYRADMVATLWSGPFKNGVYKGEASLPLTITVRDILNVAIVAPGGSFDFPSIQDVLDFGILNTAVESTRSALLLARANTTFSLSVASANQGVLKNTDPLDASTISYTLTVGGNPVNLASGTASPIVTGAPPTTAEGINLPIDAKVLPSDFPSEGEYTDVLTFTISKN